MRVNRPTSARGDDDRQTVRAFGRREAAGRAQTDRHIEIAVAATGGEKRAQRRQHQQDGSQDRHIGYTSISETGCLK